MVHGKNSNEGIFSILRVPLRISFLIIAIPRIQPNEVDMIPTLQKNKIRIKAIRPISRAKNWLSKKTVKLELIHFNFLCNYCEIKQTWEMFPTVSVKLHINVDSHELIAPRPNVPGQETIFHLPKLTKLRYKNSASPRYNSANHCLNSDSPQVKSYSEKSSIEF